MIVYDVTDPESFRQVEMWMGEVDKFAAPNVNRLLIGNKIDLAGERKVKTEEGAALAKKYGIKFLETSAKAATNVVDAFKEMTKEMHSRIIKKPTPGPVVPTPSTTTKKSTNSQLSYLFR